MRPEASSRNPVIVKRTARRGLNSALELLAHLLITSRESCRVTHDKGFVGGRTETQIPLASGAKEGRDGHALGTSLVEAQQRLRHTGP